MRSALAARVPPLKRVTTCTQGDIDGSVHRSVAHLLLVSLDALAGVVGGRVPFVTISCRTALALLKAQEEFYSDPKGPGLTWDYYAPMWALVLGAMLETKWALPFISYPGHLQDAMVGDFARSQYVSKLISG